MNLSFSKISISILLLLIICCCKNLSAQSIHSFPDSSAMDFSVKPGDNFYLYVNGTWQKKSTIPPTEAGIGSAYDVYNRTKNHLHTILEDAAASNATPGSIEQKVGDFYETGMDSSTIEQRGYEPLKPTLSQIDALSNTHDILQFIAQQATTGNELLFGCYIGPDSKNSSINIATFYQGGLGLPDRDYYFKTDSTILAVVKAYQTYITTLFKLTGDNETIANQKMLAVYELEKQIAMSHRTNVELRDPQSNYNKMSVDDINKSMPALEWKATMATLGMHPDSINIGQPAFYKKTDSLLTTIPLGTWKAYLQLHTISNYAPYLSSPFVNARFEYVKKLYGQKKLRARWERIYRIVDDNLGDALGQLYIEKYFTAEAKQKMLALVNNLQKAFEIRITKLDWMSDTTKKIAIEKLHAFIKKIGFPDKWRDYSKVVIQKGKYFENLVSCQENEYQYELNKLGKRVDKTEWTMTAPTVNAYYNPTFNEVVFPAGYLQPPLFDPAADDALNYGAIGTTIGHEMSHGFDDEGSQYDKDGNLQNWWQHDDSVKFVAKTKSIINQFNNLTVLDSVHINGALTIGENIADLGGLYIAYDAFKMTKEGQSNIKTDGYTPDQRFFLSYATMWRGKLTDALLRHLINTDPHSPNEDRVIGPLSNFTPFYKAFNVQPGDKMYKPESERIKIW